MMLSNISYAQKDIYLNEFTDPSMFNFVGTAKLFNKKIRLTEALNFQGGGIWLKDKKNVKNDFAIEIGFQITNSDPAGADGIAFVIQNTSEAIIGQYGGGIGYAGIPNGLAIEFDTYFNGDRNDPNDNHISIQSNGTGPISDNHVFTLGIASSIPVMEDGKEHVLRIEYVSKVFKVFLDDMSVPKIVSYVDMDSLLNLDNGMAWLGFTSSTGGSYANHDIVAFGHSNGLIANAGNDTTICFGKSVTIGQQAFGRGPFTYKWTSKTGLSNDTIAQPIVKPKTSTMYYVTVRDTIGNMSYDSIYVTVDTCSATIELPDKYARILDTVTYPALVIPTVNMKTLNPDVYAYTAYMHYPSTILYPLSVNVATLTHTFINDTFYLQVKGVYNENNPDTLFTLNTLALLGNDTSTVITIDSIQWEDMQGNILPLFISYLPGSCTLLDLCKEGGIRLLHEKNQKLSLKQSINKSGTSLEILNASEGKTIFELYDIQGFLILKQSWMNVNDIPKVIDLGQMGFPTGYYFAKVYDSSDMLMQPCIIIN